MHMVRNLTRTGACSAMACRHDLDTLHCNLSCNNLLPSLNIHAGACSAMAYLHDLDILHGDLSCNNILLASASDDQRGFTAKVADFGMARMAEQDEVIQTKAIGTITHMPPELMLDGMHTCPLFD